MERRRKNTKVHDFIFRKSCEQADEIFAVHKPCDVRQVPLRSLNSVGSITPRNHLPDAIADQDPSSLPMALLVSSVGACPGSVYFDSISVLPGQKVATVFEDPSIQASNVEMYRRFTHELNIYGTGFSKVVQPILVFEPPLDNAVVNVHVST